MRSWSWCVMAALSTAVLLPPIYAVEYDVFILTGQSNALGTTGSSDETPLPGEDPADNQARFFWSNVSSRNAVFPPQLYGDSGGRITTLRVQQGDGVANKAFWGPEFGLARTLAAHGRRNMVIIKATRGGGSNSLWDRNTFAASHDAGHMWGHLCDTVDTALAGITAKPDSSFRIRGLLFIQGESNTAADAALAGDRLVDLATNLAAHIEATHPGTTPGMQTVVGEIAASTKTPDRKTTTAAQRVVCENRKGFAFVSTADLPLKRDGIHFGGKAKLEIGRRMALALLKKPTTDQAATLQPAACFGSHMVLQQGMPVPVWGKATAGDRVTVSLGEDSWSTRADASGRWLVALPPRQASSRPCSLVITSGSQTQTFEDVLLGEVWLCAGQSNMLMPLAKVDDASREIAAAKHPQLRLFRVTTAAGGDGGSYSPDTIAALEPAKYAKGAWTRCTPPSAAGFSAVGYFFGERLLERLDVPVGVLCVAVGGTPTEAWVSREALAGHPTTEALVASNWLGNPSLDGWCKERARDNLGRALSAGEPIPGDQTGPNHPFKPGFMWEAGIAPLAPFGIRGVVWYQGESNADSAVRVAQHEQVFRRLVADWRKAWHDDTLPFGIVQLPGMNRPDWPAFREQQRQLVESTPHTGLVVTIDLGDPRDVHPRDKRPVGERAATWTLATLYGQPGPATGPRPISFDKASDGTITVRFSETGGRLRTTDGQPPRYFEVSAEEGVFVEAPCRIDGEAVVLSAPASLPLGGIRQIRYAWRPFPEPPVNLTGSTGLPVTPFERRVAGP